jgi:hypothetical protein
VNNNIVMPYITSTGEVVSRKPSPPLWKLPFLWLLALIEFIAFFFSSLCSSSPTPKKSGGGVIHRGGRYGAPPQNAAKPTNPNIRGMSDVGPPACAASGG